MKKLLLSIVLFISLLGGCKSQDYISYIPTVNTYELIKYGALYNWYVGTDSRNISNTGWHVPTTSEHGTLNTYAGGSFIAGGKLKETGLLHWDTPNTGATNEYGFNFRGNGDRTGNGIFENKNIQGYIWASTQAISTTGHYLSCFYNTTSTSGAPGSGASLDKKRGHGIRLVKDSTTLTHGQTGTYIGNDGKIYRTICIGTQEWLADNLAETKFRNGDYIHGYEGGVYTPISNANWAALTTEGMCFYNDDPSTYK